MKHLCIIASAVVLSVTSIAAHATTVVNIDVPQKRGTTVITCSGISAVVDCDGLLSNSLLAESNADTFAGTPANEASIASQFQSITGIPTTSGNVTKFDTPQGTKDLTFNVSGGWFFVKAGQYRSYLFADGAASVFFDKSGNDPGLSNYGYISVNAVPIPAAGFLLLAGLGGLAVLRRRRSRY
ncbi:MAG: hypothetical protein CML55_09850 [Rhodobacteraceae bacterium]|nr:hypothetical protein [Paracoccaceae bacterium]MBO28767.1 hypothetical protein [Paracoccaceae bacterium]|tara:strand:+ start:715 stop:1263 length:549 start_codon:yes stop_codon:yes gene_type:complete